MIERQLKARGIADRAVLAAFEKVPREEFIAPELIEHAYEDRPLTIACSQTISQPYIVASMLQAAELQHEDRVLEVGTGSGYQTALLAEIVREVVTIERHATLAELARERMLRFGYTNVTIIVGDGTLGHAPSAPFGAIVVSAAAPEVPRSLLDQLAMNGRMVLPVGSREQQDLVLVRRQPDGVTYRRLDGCAFVPLIGEQAFDA